GRHTHTIDPVGVRAVLVSKLHHAPDFCLLMKSSAALMPDLSKPPYSFSSQSRSLPMILSFASMSLPCETDTSMASDFWVTGSTPVSPRATSFPDASCSCSSGPNGTVKVRNIRLRYATLQAFVVADAS